MKNKKGRYTYAILFALYFAVHFLFLKSPVFDTDEEDITLAGKAIARGFVLYREYTSQHMPVSYYVSAVFEFLGAHSIYAQRIMFYIFFSAMWVLIYKIYKKDFNSKALAVYPFIFMCEICSYEYGGAVLSEHLAGIGMVILLLEFLRFRNLKELSWQQMVLICVAVLLTFGTMFVTVFSVAVIVLGVFIKELSDIRNDKTTGRDLKLKERIISLGKLVGITVAPWAVYIVYLALIGNLSLFIYSAYTMNRTIYPKYLGSFSNGILGSVAESFSTGFGSLAGNRNISNIVVIVGFIAFVTYLAYVKKRYVDSVITLMLVVICGGTRGMFAFHGSHSVELLCLTTALFFFEVCYGKLCDRSKAGIIPIMLTTFCIIAVVTPATSFLSYLSGTEERVQKPIVSLIKEITDEDEGIWMCSTDNDLFQECDRVPVYGISLSPWWYEAQHERVLETLGDDPPRICILDVGYTVWGYQSDEYAAEMIQYVHEHYTQLTCAESGTRVYVRNDMIDTIPEQYR